MAETSLAHGPTLVATAPGAGERLAAGEKAGDYVIDAFLGAGAMGEVYAGRHPVIGKRVAIKVLRRELAASPEASERFVREARAVNQVAHPSVVDVFAFGRLDDGRHYLVMDLIEGKSLRAALADGPLPLDRALAILATIADALDAAHARGVVHRDLKPDNVMLAVDDKVFVLDFGIAKLVAADGATGNGTLTGQGTWLGTPGYMAPEQWSADGAGPASDRYALGVTAYELLAGKPPFSAPTLPAMMEQHFRTPVPAIGSTRGSIPSSTGARSEVSIAPRVEAALDRVLARAMAKQPADRFATAHEMVDALRAAAAGTAPSPRRPWVAAAAATGVLVLSVGGVIAMRGGDDDPAKPAIAVPPADQLALAITTNPAGAEVKSAGQLVGATPLTMHPLLGEHLVIDVRKPGYRTVHRELTVDRGTALDVVLEASDGYQGVWRLDNGELRAFQRAGEHVDIFKLESATGPRVPYRSYQLVPSDDGVDFEHEEDVTDDRGTDARCHVPHHVHYHYDPKDDALVLQRERIGIAIQSGSCVVVSRDPGARVALQRVDSNPKDVRFSDAPAGLPKAPRPKGPRNLDKKGLSSSNAPNEFLKFGKGVPNQPMDNTMADVLDAKGKPSDQENSQKRAPQKASPPPPDVEPQQALPQQANNPPPPQAPTQKPTPQAVQRK